MAYEGPQTIKMAGVTAGADMRVTGQYRFVKLSADNQVITTSAITDKICGVLQNNPNLGQAADVLIVGVTKMQGNGAITAGSVLGTHTDGRGKAIVPGTDTTQYVAGQVIAGCGSAGEFLTAAIDCSAPARAA